MIEVNLTQGVVAVLGIVVCVQFALIKGLRDALSDLERRIGEEMQRFRERERDENKYTRERFNDLTRLMHERKHRPKPKKKDATEVKESLDFKKSLESL